MAVIRQRINRKNASGGYDVIHLETDASMVILSDGRNVETALTDLTNKTATTVTVIPWQANTITFTGELQEPEWNGYDPRIMTISGTKNSTSAGEHSVVFTLIKGYQWSDGGVSKVVTWEIKHKPVEVPTQSNTLTYTGEEQSPIWDNYNPDMMSISGAIAGFNAGEYAAEFTLKPNYCWPDGSTSVKSIPWTIEKADGILTLSETDITLVGSSVSKDIVATKVGDGIITATSSNPSIATCNVDGDIITVNSGTSDGSCSIEVSVEPGTNHTAAFGTINVVRSTYTLGQGIWWAGHTWVVFHMTADRIYLARNTIYEMCIFGNDVNYKGSNLAARAMAFQQSLSPTALERLADVYVNGVTAKVFVASSDQMRGGFDYFDSKEKRICKNSSNVAVDWWTSSGSGSSCTCVGSEGGLWNNIYTEPTYSEMGFRPFVAWYRS